MSGIRDRVVDLRRVRAGDLQENPKNWRLHPDRQRKALQGILDEVGFADAILAREADDGALVVIDGHLRRSIDPDMTVPVLVLDVDETEADKLLASLDPLAALASPDADALAALLGSIDARSEELRSLYADLAREAESVSGLVGGTDPDEVPPAPRSPTTRPGDLFVMGEHRLLCGDARDGVGIRRLVGSRTPSLLVTDPPYGVAYEGKTSAKLRIAGDQPGDAIELLASTFAHCDAVMRPGAAIYVFHPAGADAPSFLAAVAERWELKQTLVWVKDSLVLGHGDYHFRHEPIAYARKAAPTRRGRGAGGWYGGNAETTVLEVARPKVSREHPTAKPVELLGRLVANSSILGDAVLDPFVGSGSTVIACEQLGRRCLAIEIDPVYVDVAVARWEAFTGRRARRYRTRRR